MIKSWVRVAGLAMLMLILPTTVAVADSDQLGLSRDGNTWTSSLQQPLLDKSFVWVPGDKKSVTVFARNDSAEAAQLSINLVDQAGQQLIDQDLIDVDVEIKGKPVELTEQAQLIVPQFGAGASEPVKISVSFTAEALNDTQLTKTPITLQLHLRQLFDDLDDDRLPNTGAPPATMIIFAGLLSLGAGANLLRSTTAKEKLP